MNISEIEKRITYSERAEPQEMVRVVATLTISGWQLVERRYLKEAQAQAQATAKESLLRALYESPTCEIHEAMRQMMIEVHPTALGLNFNPARERLFKAILRRPPNECELYGIPPAEALAATLEKNKELLSKNKKLIAIVRQFIKWAEEKHFVPGKLTELVEKGKEAANA